MDDLEKYQSVFLSRKGLKLDLIEKTVEESRWLISYDNWVHHTHGLDQDLRVFKLLFLLELWTLDKCGGEYYYRRTRTMWHCWEDGLKNV